MSEESIPVQGFTRVHMVPRVNQGRVVALAFELPGALPVAYGAPVEVLSQLFLQIPYVLEEAKKVRDVANLPSDLGLRKAARPWVVESCECRALDNGLLGVSVQMAACFFDFQLTNEQSLSLIKDIAANLGLSIVNKRTVKPKAVDKPESNKAVAESMTAKVEADKVNKKNLIKNKPSKSKKP